jgi:hypothetical protein
MNMDTKMGEAILKEIQKVHGDIRVMDEKVSANFTATGKALKGIDELGARLTSEVDRLDLKIDHLEARLDKKIDGKIDGLRSVMATRSEMIQWFKETHDIIRFIGTKVYDDHEDRIIELETTVIQA